MTDEEIDIVTKMKIGYRLGFLYFSYQFFLHKEGEKGRSIKKEVVLSLQKQGLIKPERQQIPFNFLVLTEK